MTVRCSSQRLSTGHYAHRFCNQRLYLDTFFITLYSPFNATTHTQKLHVHMDAPPIGRSATLFAVASRSSSLVLRCTSNANPALCYGNTKFLLIPIIRAHRSRVRISPALLHQRPLSCPRCTLLPRVNAYNKTACTRSMRPSLLACCHAHHHINIS